MAKKKLTIEDVLVPKEEIPYEVPENWCWVKLGTVIKVSSGKNLTKSKMNEDGTIPVYGGNGFVGNHDDFNVEEAKIIIGRVGANCGNVHITDNKAWITDNAFIVSYDEEVFDEQYLYYLLSECDLGKYSNSSAQPVISGQKIYDVAIQIPPLAEQVRIVNRIESLFDKVDKASELVDEARDGFEKRRAAILERAFSGELTKKWREENGVSDASEELEYIKKSNNRKYQKVENEYLEREIPNNWCWTNLGELIELLSDYHSNGSYKILKEKVELLDEENYSMMIRTTNFEKNNFEDLMKYITKDAYEFMEKSKLFGGEILINKIGNAGSAYYMPHFNKPASLAMNLFMLRLVSGVDSKYIYYHLNTIYSTSDIKQFVRGITTKTIDKKSINSLKIALPPLEEQSEIVRIVDSLLENESDVDDICNMQESINDIKKSILAKAFRGEIGSNDLDEEHSLDIVKQLIK